MGATREIRAARLMGIFAFAPLLPLDLSTPKKNGIILGVFASKASLGTRRGNLLA